MSWKVFLKIRSRLFSRCFALPLVLELLEALQHREQAEVHRAHVERRQFGLEQWPRAHALLDGHVRAAAGGDVDDGVGAALDACPGTGGSAPGPATGGRLSGSRACRCTMAAPALAASMAASAISSGVTGRCGDMLGVWMAPVTAQVMMTLRSGCHGGRSWWTCRQLSACGVAVDDQLLAGDVERQYRWQRTAPCWRCRSAVDHAAERGLRRVERGDLVSRLAQRLGLGGDDCVDARAVDRAGQMALTRMPSAPSSIASVLVKPITAHFDAE